MVKASRLFFSPLMCFRPKKKYTPNLPESEWQAT